MSSWWCQRAPLTACCPFTAKSSKCKHFTSNQLQAFYLTFTIIFQFLPVSFCVTRVTTALSAVLQACTGSTAPHRAPAKTRSPAHTLMVPASAEKVVLYKHVLKDRVLKFPSLLCFRIGQEEQLSKLFL